MYLWPLVTKINPLPLDFYLSTDVVELAQRLLGCTLCTHFAGEFTSGMIVETEAEHRRRLGVPVLHGVGGAFAEPRYLHQVTGRMRDGTLLRALDLPELDPPDPRLLDPRWAAAEAS